MKLLRIITDGILISACFNLITGFILVTKPEVFTTCYPKKIREIAPENKNALKHKLKFVLFVILPLLILGITSARISGISGFKDLFFTGYIEWFIVNSGDFFGLDIYLREKYKEKIMLENTKNSPYYERKNWLKSLGIPEHFILWPFIVCPFMGLIYAISGIIF